MKRLLFAFQRQDETKPARQNEAASLNDLVRIRATNRPKIEAINGNLGTALGYKWTDGKRTNHQSVIIFVPQKLDPSTVPDPEKAPDTLSTPDGNWCYTDVVTGGATSPEDIQPLPDLSEENQRVLQELMSGEIGLIGGIQLAVYEGGIEGSEHAVAGTAGIAVKHKETGSIGFLTNQHVGEVPGRRIDHPWVID